MSDKFIPKANFFLVGAAKAGTTSLHNYLKAHPNLFFSPVKEPNYFSTDIQPENFSANYRKNTFLNTEKYFNNKPLKKLQLTFVRKKEHYQQLFENANGYKAIGESSTSYLYSETAAQNIKKYNPQAKIIIIIRNPLERAFSHYLMALKFGFTSKSFQAAIKADIERKKKGWGISELFIELGLYYKQIKRYLDHFPARQVKIFLFDDFEKNPEKVIGECFEFLELKPLPLDSFPVYNKASAPRFKHLNRIMTKTGIKDIAGKIAPPKAKKALKSIAFSNNKQQEIDLQTANLLKKYFNDDIQLTAKLINKDLNHWLSFSR